MNKQGEQTKLIHTDNSAVVTRMKEFRVTVKSKGGQIRHDRRRLDFGGWAHNEIYR